MRELEKAARAVVEEWHCCEVIPPSMIKALEQALASDCECETCGQGGPRLERNNAHAGVFCKECNRPWPKQSHDCTDAQGSEFDPDFVERETGEEDEDCGCYFRDSEGTDYVACAKHGGMRDSGDGGGETYGQFSRRMICAQTSYNEMQRMYYDEKQEAGRWKAACKAFGERIPWTNAVNDGTGWAEFIGMIDDVHDAMRDGDLDALEKVLGIGAKR